MSLLLSWICLNSYAQLPHPNDTLDNGKKVPFNQFLGRLSFYTEGFGPAYIASFNVGYSLVKTETTTIDLTAGLIRLPIQSRSINPSGTDSYVFPVGLSSFFGRRKSRFNLKLGYTTSLQPDWFKGKTDYPSCGYACPGPVQHVFNVGLGYVYQHPTGFFFGAHAYLLIHLNEEATRNGPGPPADFWPQPGVTLGYRMPSRQLRKEWTERTFKKRILRLEEPKEKKTKKKEDEEEDWLDDTGELQVDSIEMAEIEARLAKLRKRHLRYQLQEKRENGRSHVFAEGFGAAGNWSVNYSYTFPVTKSELVALDFRGGVGMDDHTFQVPIHAGVKVMKNFRGTGVYAGVQPVINWEQGTAGAIYFLEHNVEFHFAYGLTGGVAFYLFFDPELYKYRSTVAPYGGFFLGYRLPKLKKN